MPLTRDNRIISYASELYLTTMMPITTVPKIMVVHDRSGRANSVDLSLGENNCNSMSLNAKMSTRKNSGLCGKKLLVTISGPVLGNRAMPVRNLRILQ